MNFDIFISYRRIETADKAEHMFSLLEYAGYKGRVSFDRENLDGRFDLEILKRLDNCQDFIVILASSTLNNLNVEDTIWYQRLALCSAEEFPLIETEMHNAGLHLDFVRLEIARALAQGKHIIPVVPVNTIEYNFDRLNLPNDISLLIKEHAEKYQDSKDFLFKDILPRIIKRLKSKSNKGRWYRQLGVAIVTIAAIACIGGIILHINEYNSFSECRTFSDYQSFADHSIFFKARCLDSLESYRNLTKSSAAINDAINTYSKDSILVKWGKDCSLTQLRILRHILNNMMFVEKGDFEMGTDTPIGLENIKHKENIEEDFYIGKFEITEFEWNVIMHDSTSGETRYPKTDITWNECQQFVRQLQSMTGVVFQLPTEKQWEYAARKGEEDDWYYSGSNIPEDVAIYEKNSDGKSGRIDAMKPNPLELYNMSGNVAEWCLDGYQDRKVIRGGSFMSSKEEITVYYSDVASVDHRSKSIGCRLVII